MTCLLNNILEQEQISKSWFNLFMFMLYKKGIKENPTNYRGTALSFGKRSKITIPFIDFKRACQILKNNLPLNPIAYNFFYLWYKHLALHNGIVLIK
jgi:hypothetical protein